jgi:hypothetical protein
MAVDVVPVEHRLGREVEAPLWRASGLRGRPPNGAHAVRLVPYEAFTKEPEQMLRAICEFVGEPFVEFMLRNLAGGSWRVAHWERSSNYGQVTSETKDRREFISWGQAREIEERLERRWRCLATGR